MKENITLLFLWLCMPTINATQLLIPSIGLPWRLQHSNEMLSSASGRLPAPLEGAAI